MKIISKLSLLPLFINNTDITLNFDGSKIWIVSYEQLSVKSRVVYEIIKTFTGLL